MLCSHTHIWIYHSNTEPILIYELQCRYRAHTIEFFQHSLAHIEIWIKVVQLSRMLAQTCTDTFAHFYRTDYNGLFLVPCMKLFNSDYWEEAEHLLDQESGGTYIHKLHIPPVPAYSIVYTYIHRYVNNTFISVQIAKGRQRIMNAVSNLNLLTALITP